MSPMRPLPDSLGPKALLESLRSETASAHLHKNGLLKIPRRRFLQLAAGASSLPAMPRTARAQIATWRSLDVMATSAPAVCSWGPSRLDVFAPHLDGCCSRT
jgi:hypothetical protein